MPFSNGDRVGHYEIVSILGVGGMGEVYRARDTRLPREVAIKVSTVAFDERFAREAQMIASLNHPNVCTLFDVGPNYLVMELVEGETLQDRIQQGALPLEEASRIARQIAEALDYAHEHGVVHRDLKPANIKVRPDGVVKVLDFGLAKAVQSARSEEAATVSMDATRAGAILGTPNYMSPEQATGRPTDKRADTWAFGIVFYEMLSGTKPFGGPTLSESIASTLRDTPDLEKVPAQVRRLIRRCLEKDPQSRLRHLGDVMSLIDEAPGAAAASLPAAPAKTSWLWPAVAAVGLAAAATVAFVHFREQPEKSPPVQFEFSLPKGTGRTLAGTFSISPDGQSIVFAALTPTGSHWYIRRMDSTDTRALDLTTPVLNNSMAPTWSPDSRYFIYYAGNKVVKVDTQSGDAKLLCDPCDAYGASWSKDGTILLGDLREISRIPENGGERTLLTKAGEESMGSHLNPVWLPDGKHFIYTAATNGANSKIGLKIGSTDTKPEEQSPEWLVESPAGAQWVAPSNGRPGYLLYVSVGNALVARPFDPDKLAFTGEPTSIAQVDLVANWGWAAFSASSNGSLVYRAFAANQRQLTWIDQSGRVTGTMGDPGATGTVVMSPDSNRTALAIEGNNAAPDIWVADHAAGTRTRLTTEPGIDGQPVWSPDGSAIYFNSQRNNRWFIVRRPSSGASGEQIMYEAPEKVNAPNLSHVSPDGKLLVFHQAADIWMLDVSKPGSMPQPLLKTGANEAGARVSPDGRYFIYRSNESGRFEVYVQAMPGYGAPAGKWLVSRDGSMGMGRWRKDGREVYFLSDGAVMAADVTLSPSFKSGPPRKLFDVPSAFKVLFSAGQPGALVDMTSDGQRFLFAVPVTDASGIPFKVTTDWRAALVK